MINNNSFTRRSISIPNVLDKKLDIMLNKFSYSSKNELILELLELGLIKFDEDIELKNLIRILISKLDNLLKE